MVIATIRDLAISIGLAILVPMTINFGLKVFMPRPLWPDSSETISILRERIQELKKQDKMIEANALQEELEEVLEPLNNAYYTHDLPRYNIFLLAIWVSLGLIFVMLSFFISVGFLGAGFLSGGIAAVIFGVMKTYCSLFANFYILFGLFVVLVIFSFLYSWRKSVVAGEGIRQVAIAMGIAVLIPLSLHYRPYGLLLQVVISIFFLLLGFFIPITFLSAGFIMGGVGGIVAVVAVLGGGSYLLFFSLLGMLVVLTVLSYFFFVRERKKEKREKS